MKNYKIGRRYCSSFFSNESGQTYGRSLIKAKDKAYGLKIIKDQGQSFEKVRIMGSKDAMEYAKQFYKDDIGIYESMFVLFLNRNNTTIAWVKISQGGVTGCVVDPKMICKYAMDILAEGVILVHNHPSGNTMPSENDLQITSKVKKMLAVCEVQLMDHIILTETDEYYSLADNGELF